MKLDNTKIIHTHTWIFCILRCLIPQIAVLILNYIVIHSLFTISFLHIVISLDIYVYFKQIILELWGNTL